MIRRKQILWIKLVQKIPKKLATWFKDDPLLILIEYIFIIVPLWPDQHS